MRRNSTCLISGFAVATAIFSGFDANAQTTINGTVYNDANGLTDNVINGVPVSSSMLPAGVTLYVALVNNANQVTAFTPVPTSGAGNGTYTISGGAANSVILTTTLPVVGTNPTVGLPASLAYTGEGTLINGDGQEDGTVTVGTSAGGPVAVNFGIDRRPQTMSATISNLQYNADGRIIIPASVFNGFDAEDAPSGYSNNLTGRSVDLYQASGGMLYYDAVAIVFQSASVATSIQNFDPTKLTFLRYNNPPYSFSFSYSVRDNANVSELVPSTVSYSGSPLAMTLSAYGARRDGNLTSVWWTTATEEGTAGFSVERSADGITFDELGRVTSQSKDGVSGRDLNYRFEDGTANTATTYYYRIREIIYGGQATVSPVMRVSAAGTTDVPMLRLTPNPTHGPLQVSIWQGQSGAVSISVVDLTGRVAYRDSWDAIRGTSNREIPAGSIPAGTYILRIRTATGEQLVQTFTIAL